ncbi:MAG: DEAD/DEAH box helicase [Egibacteraceae bacterium]
MLAEQLRLLGRDPFVLKGGMGKKARARVFDSIAASASHGGLLLVATGPHLGEGFDCPRLDTLFLAFPLAFKGRIVQYVGRVLRAADGKNSVEVHDYVDINVPVLTRMHSKRLPAFASLGFNVPDTRRRC